MFSSATQFVRQRRTSVLNDGDLLEVRARERTFDGAYLRTALNAFMSGIVILKVFSREFIGCGFAFIAFSAILFIIGLVRRKAFLRDIMLDKPFVTSGWYVVSAAVAGMAVYVSVLVVVVLL